VAEVKQVIDEMLKITDFNYPSFNWEGYDHDEIGEILGMTNAAVRTGYSRARKKLQKC
jgi:hypothetical protein